MGTEIAYPTAARFLLDSIRMLTRIMKHIQNQLPLFEFGFANRARCSKKLCDKITMAKVSNAGKIRKKHYRRLIRVAMKFSGWGAPVTIRYPILIIHASWRYLGNSINVNDGF